MTDLIDRLRMRAVGHDEREQKSQQVRELAGTLLDVWTRGFIRSEEPTTQANFAKVIQNQPFTCSRHRRRTNKRRERTTDTVNSKRGKSSSSRCFQALKRELMLRWVQWQPMKDPNLDFVPPSAVEHKKKLAKKLEKGHKIKKLSE